MRTCDVCLCHVEGNDKFCFLSFTQLVAQTMWEWPMKLLLILLYTYKLILNLDYTLKEVKSISFIQWIIPIFDFHDIFRLFLAFILLFFHMILWLYFRLEILLWTQVWDNQQPFCFKGDGRGRQILLELCHGVTLWCNDCSIGP